MVEHHIDSGEAHPIKVQPQCFPWAYLEAADKHLEEMLNGGILESFNNPCASLVVMASKKNKTRHKDSNPLPRFNESSPWN